MKPCPRCNHEVQEDQAECPNCGVVFAKWDAAHSSSPAPVSPAVLATSKFTPRHQKYLGVVLVILSLALFILGRRIEVPTIAGIGCLLSGIGLALYAMAWGHGPVMGFLLGLVPLLGPLIGFFVFAMDKRIKPRRSILIELVEVVAVVAIVGLLKIAISANHDYQYKAKIFHVKSETIEPILAALEVYYKKNGRFPISTTATTVTPSMSGTLDKGPDVWTSMGLDKRPVFSQTSTGYSVSQLDYTSDATGSTMTLTLTMANFGTDSIDGKIISVTPSPEKETTITWVNNCSFETQYCPMSYCREYSSGHCI